MNPEKRKTAVEIILGKMGPSKGESREKPVDESNVGLETAVEELFTAAEAKDWSGAAVALKSFLEQCGGEYEEPPSMPRMRKARDEEDDEDDYE